MTRQGWTTGAVLLGIVVGIAMCWPVPEADPPLHRQTGAMWSDETIAHDARNAYLWGERHQDAYHPFVAGPLLTIAVEWSFRAFGMDYFGLRFPSMVSVSLLVLLAFAQLRAIGGTTQGGLAAAFALATSWAVTGFARTLNMEPLMMLMLSACLLCVLKGESSRGAASLWYLAAGLFAGLAALTKLSAFGVVAPMGIYLVLGGVARSSPSPVRWRIGRAVLFALPCGLVVLAGAFVWIAPEFEGFKSLVWEAILTSRHKRSVPSLARNIAFLLDSQAFLTTPALMAAVALLLPGLWRRSDTLDDRKRFAVGLAVTVLIGSVLMIVNFDVPARRLLYVNLFVAFLFGILWDTAAQDASETPSLPSSGRLARLGVLVACGAAAYICLGWLISPNGGLIALFAPRTAARMLFTIRANVAYKLGLAFGALALGLVVYSVWRRLGPWLWRERSRVLTAIVVFQLLTYGVSCGLWFSRLSYTCRDASRALGEHVAEGEYVLGERALSLSFHNRIKPLYWHPGIAYANKDEGRIRARFDPRFMVLPEIQVDALRNGALPCSPYVASFLENEIARFPIYELHESPELSCDVILYRHEAAAE